MDIDAIVSSYVALRDQKAEIAERHKAEMAPYNQGLSDLEGLLMGALDKAGLQSAKTPHGTAYKNTVSSAKVIDWGTVLDFIIAEERYDLLARCGVRHLDSYNKMEHGARLERMGVDLASDEATQIPDKMPYIVIIADEMADMMMTSGKDVEGHIIRLAQKSRAVGIHLVLATQKPTVDVITGLIKSNLPARISFQVASRTDSRVVLDEGGADKLLGNGDMLFLAPGTSNLTRAQGTFVSDEEVNSVIDFFAQYEPEYSDELAKISTAGGGTTNASALKERDELYEQAIDVIVREGRGSVSLLQRALGIGYGRGARLIDFMAEDGIVGDYNGSQAREVLFTPEQWEAFKSGTIEDATADDPAFA